MGVPLIVHYWADLQTLLWQNACQMLNVSEDAYSTSCMVGLFCDRDITSQDLLFLLNGVTYSRHHTPQTDQPLKIIYKWMNEFLEQQMLIHACGQHLLAEYINRGVPKEGYEA